MYGILRAVSTQVENAEGEKLVQVRVPFSLAQRIDEIAREDGLSRNKKVVELIRREVERRS